MRCLYATSRSDSALIRSLTESGFNLHVVAPAEMAWALEDASFAVVLYEYTEENHRYFPALFARRRPDTAVVVLVPKDNHKLRAELLRAGADYCLTQPASVFELEAVLLSFFRRSKTQTEVTAEPTAAGSAPLILNLRRRQLLWKGKPIVVSEREIALLRILMRADGAATDRQVLWQEVWESDTEFSTQAIDLAISRLRRKLRDSPVAIISLRGFGYRLSGRFQIQ